MLKDSVYKWAFTSFLLCMALILSCGERSPSPCDNLAEKKMGITREEYLPCASEIMAVLDRLRQQVKAIRDGNKEVWSHAKQSNQELKTLMRKVGIDLDHLNPVKLVEKWPDWELRALNHYIFQASFCYYTVLTSESQASRFGTEKRSEFIKASNIYFEKGEKAYEEASSVYRRIK